MPPSDKLGTRKSPTFPSVQDNRKTQETRSNHNVSDLQLTELYKKRSELPNWMTVQNDFPPVLSCRERIEVPSCVFKNVEFYSAVPEFPDSPVVIFPNILHFYVVQLSLVVIQPEPSARGSMPVLNTSDLPSPRPFSVITDRRVAMEVNSHCRRGAVQVVTLRKHYLECQFIHFSKKNY